MSFTRLDVEERRRRLLAHGERLFAEHGYEALSMARIAREAGISKALLYHYFPSKRAYFVATFEAAAAELAARVEPDPALPPAEQLAHAVGAFLGWIEEHADAYRQLQRSAEARDLIERVRAETAARIVAGIGVEPTPELRIAVTGWLWFMDGAVLDWLAHRDVPRERVRDLLLRALPLP